MGTLSDRLRQDLTAAMKSRDELTKATLRMTLTAIRNAEVAGKASRELTDDEVLTVVTKEAKKRQEAAEAFAAAGRAESASRERAEGEILARYLPAQLTEEELVELVRAAIAGGGFSRAAQMGQVMKVVRPQVAGRADGKRVAEEVRRQLTAG